MIILIPLLPFSYHIFSLPVALHCFIHFPGKFNSSWKNFWFNSNPISFSSYQNTHFISSAKSLYTKKKKSNLLLNSNGARAIQRRIALPASQLWERRRNQKPPQRRCRPRGNGTVAKFQGKMWILLLLLMVQGLDRLHAFFYWDWCVDLWCSGGTKMRRPLWLLLAWILISIMSRKLW